MEMKNVLREKIPAEVFYFRDGNEPWLAFIGIIDNIPIMLCTCMNENIKNLIKLSLNSFIAYILSYLIIFVPSQFVSFLAAKTYYIPISFNHFKLVFQAADYSSLWTQSSVVSVYLSVPVFVFVLGIFYLF